jgi:WD repeat-containing protein 61
MSSETGQIFIFDLESNSLSAAFTSHAMSVRSIAWSPDSTVRVPYRPAAFVRVI